LDVVKFESSRWLSVLLLKPHCLTFKKDNLRTPIESGCPISITISTYVHTIIYLFSSVRPLQNKLGTKNISHCLHFFDTPHIPEPHMNYTNSIAQKYTHLFLYIPQFILLSWQHINVYSLYTRMWAKQTSTFV
jgi:hypothetical protein